MLPEGWSKHALGEIVTIVMGQAPSGDTYNIVGDGLPLLQGCAEFGDVFPIPKRYCSRPTKRAAAGSVLVSVRAPVGEINQADQEYCIGRGIAAIEAGPSTDAGYLPFLMATLSKHFSMRSTGSTFEGINRATIASASVLLPALDEQSRIVAVLEQADRAVGAAVRHAADAEALLKMTIENEVDGDGRRPDWADATLSELIRHRKEAIMIEDVTEYRLCRVQLHGRGVVLREIRSGSSIKTKRQFICRSGDWLVAEIDAKFGGMGLIGANLDGAIVSSHYYTFESIPDVSDIRFIELYFRTPAGRAQISPQGTTNYSSVRPSAVLAWTICIPPLAEQQAIVARIEKVEAAVRAAKAHLERLRALRSSLLENLVSGRVRLPTLAATTPEVTA